jgi:hypothetical protein
MLDQPGRTVYRQRRLCISRTQSLHLHLESAQAISLILDLEEVAQQKITPVLRMFCTLHNIQRTTMSEHTSSNRSATGGKKQWESTNLDEKSDVIRMYGRND